MFISICRKTRKNLHQQIKEKADDKQVFYVYGGVETEDRETIREVTEKSTMLSLLLHSGLSAQALIYEFA